MAHDETMRLIVLRGLEGRREYTLKGERLVVGRSDAPVPPEIAIDAPGIESRHAVLTREGDTYRLEPEPAAVVLVNRRAFAGGLLRDGDQVAFGGALFQFWAGGLHGRAPAPYGDSAATSAQRADASEQRRSSRIFVIAIVALAILAAVAYWLIRTNAPGAPPQP
jgi:FHA domain-containing protein